MAAVMRSQGHRSRRAGARGTAQASLVLAAVLGSVSTATAQGEGRQPQQPEALRELQRRNDDLEERVRRLEEALQERDEQGALEQETLDYGEDYGLVFRYGEVVASFEMFGDVGFEYNNPEPAGDGSSHFFLGDVSLFVNAQIGDHFRLLSETALTGRSDDGFNIAQERLWGSWEFSDALYLKLGTEHSRISRWNQRYHHGNFLATSISRPYLANFEGGQGILPLHHTGLEIGGSAHPDAGILEYWSAISNGRGPVPGDKQRTRDRNDSKRIDAGLAFLPHGVENLRVGSSFTYDEIPPDPTSPDPERSRSTRELVVAGHAEYRVGGLWLLGELAWMAHEARASDRTSESHTGYLQAAYHWEQWIPYTRFDYRNMAEGDPFFSPTGRDLDRWRQVVGIRCDFAQNVAFKIEFAAGREETRSGGSIAEETVFDAAFQVAWSL